MAGPLATIDRVASKVGEPIEATDEISLATEMLDEASNWVRFYAGQEWSAADAPGIAITIAIAAAARGYLNPAGYDMERTDAATFNRDKGGGWAQAARPTPDEIAVLKTYNRSSRSTLQSIPMSAPERIIPRSGGRRGPDFEVGYQEPFTYVPGS